MATARVVLLLDTGDHAALYRFTETGEYAGDTWHESIAGARRQSEFEFGGSAEDWREVSTRESDSILEATRSAGVDASAAIRLIRTGRMATFDQAVGPGEFDHIARSWHVIVED